MVPRTSIGLIGLTVGPSTGLVFDAAVMTAGEPAWPRSEALVGAAGIGLPGCLFEFAPGFDGTGTDFSLGTLP